jgi:2-polyprenyl-3-methyl-5-hydroxy-6-metoxy-1,4-benzoquinol methylase
MEYVGCNLCGDTVVNRRVTYRYHADPRISYQLVRCRRCELVYVNPRPEHAEVLSCSHTYQVLLRDMRQKLQASRLGRLGIRMMRRARTPEGPTYARSILDIGCATGEYLAYLRDAGWKVSGIEMDPQAAAHAREALGLPVATGTAETALKHLSLHAYDVVTMWHVLEHLNDPHRVLLEIRRVLKPGGTLLLEVPNLESIWSVLLGESWFPIEYPYHRYHFTPRTLRRMLTSTGFTVQSLQGQPAPAETTWSFQMRWNRILKQAWDGRLLWSPTGIVTLYPLEVLLAWLGRTNHMRATATPAITMKFCSAKQPGKNRRQDIYSP